MMQHVAVIGAGAFGTALALVAHRAGRDVTLWGRNANEVEAIAAERENARYLRGVDIPEAIELTADLTRCGGADLWLLAVPAQATRVVAAMLVPEMRSDVPVVACAKGLEHESGRRQSGNVNRDQRGRHGSASQTISCLIESPSSTTPVRAIRREATANPWCNVSKSRK